MIGIGGLGTSETSRKSETARENLEAIWEKQVAYRKGHRSYLTFTDGTASTWASLGVVLPAAVNHKYSAAVKDGDLVVTAAGNLDADAFEDVWSVNTETGAAYQLKNDASDVELVQRSD